MQNLDLSKDVDTCKFGDTNAEKHNQILLIVCKYVQHIEKLKKLHDDMNDEILEKTSKTHAIKLMMKKCKKAFDNAFLTLTSECQTVMDLTKQKRVLSRADILVT